jgi:hypothetical protein
MVNGIIYYGAPITGSQTVSEALRIRNINLLKSSVRSIEPSGVRYIVSPSYDIYVENLHIAMESAETGQPLPVSTTNRYIRSSNKTNLEGFSKTHVIWNYEGIQPAMDQTAMDAMKARFDPSEISVHGKPCFVAELTIPQLVALKASSVNTTTPTVSGAINVASAYAQIKLQRIARSFLLTHQYPLSSDGADTRAEMKKLFNIVAWNATHKVRTLQPFESI